MAQTGKAQHKLVEMPDLQTYLAEFHYMPWGRLVNKVIDRLIEEVPRGGSVADLMCGPGYLMHVLARYRPDLRIVGIDVNEGYVAHAAQDTSLVLFAGDVMRWRPREKFDAVVVTGGLHHLRYAQQPRFIRKVAGMLKPEGVAYIADPYIEHWHTERDRKIAAAKLGYEYMVSVVRSGAPQALVAAALKVMRNDVLGLEFKTSIRRILPVFETWFRRMEMQQTWPTWKEKPSYGDYYFRLTDARVRRK